MSEMLCQQCGASVRGYVCEYCGSLARLSLERAAEKEALNELHNIIVAQTEPEMKAKLLRHSFLPDAPENLIEAGMRCIPLVDIDMDNEVSDAAARRLQAVTAKLRLLGENGQTSAALREFETVLANYEKADRQLTRAFVVGAIIVSVLLIAACVWLFWL